ncbi:MAG: protein kinase [Leptolyngbyaceae cyanobacterium bins.349]|nr:protein kinase [Leptolyngbyaceae cyanobacterium bins.349]
MSEPAVAIAAHCINPDCSRPVVRSLVSHVCPSCKTTLRLSDRYIPLEQLSSNRYVATYRVYDLKTKANAVMKVLLETSPRATEHFRYTAKVLGGMRCPGLPRVGVDSYFSVPLRGSVHSLLCFVIEEIPGKSLQTVMDEYPDGCPEGWVLEWLRQIVDTLHFLHGRHLVHGNLIPENLLLREDTDQIVLIGFSNPKHLPGGSGRVSTEARSPAHAYKPPQQLAGSDVNASSDLFAVGRICIQLLTGIHPADLEDAKTGKLRWRHRARVSAGLMELLDKLTHPSPALRPPTALDVKTTVAVLGARKEKNPKQRPTRATGMTQRSVKRPSPASRSRPAAAQPVTVMQDVRVATAPLPEISDVLVRLVQAMVNVALTSAITAVIGFWLVFYSPLSGSAQQWLTTWGRSLPWMVSPAIVLFMLTGIGTVWGLTAPRDDRPLSFWMLTVRGGAGYGLSWLSWQWWQGDVDPMQAIDRCAAIAALFLAFEGYSNRNLWHIPITVLGTSFTTGLFVRSQFLRLDHLIRLFSPGLTVPLPFDSAFTQTSVLFLASLGATICFWSGFSHLLVQPLLRGLWKQRS